MLIAQNILPLIITNIRVHNFLTTPLHKFTENDGCKLQVSTQTQRRYIFRTVVSFFFCLCQCFQISYKFQTESLKIYDVIQSVVVTGSISLHFIFVYGHYSKRQDIANLFNEFVAFEKRHNGKIARFIFTATLQISVFTPLV